MDEDKKHDNKGERPKAVELLAEIFVKDERKKEGDAKPPKNKSNKFMLKIVGVLLVGVLLLAVSSKISNKGAEKANKLGEDKVAAVVNPKVDTPKEESSSYEAQMEKRLKTILRKMQGVGQVEVMITTTYGEEIILAEDVTSHQTITKEEDREGGSREIDNSDMQKKTVMQNGNVATGNSPIIVKEKRPEIQGVLIIAQGASNSAVKQSILESAQILLGIPAHRVTVHQLQNSNK